MVRFDGRVVGISNVRCVIQDCTQAMGAVHPDGAMVGTKGFAGVCSFTTPSCRPDQGPLAPTFSIPVVPPCSSEEQIHFSGLVRCVLSGEKSCVPVSCSSM
ncbi:hypothetical protein, partial [Streptomyces sp. uw30]|uniref:hypothetical protein n=1 Tax=Streptomyces sp. uw30 TaxID=1828179 RepID=UPI001C9CE96F